LTGRTALNLAVQLGNLNIIKTLMAHCPDISIHDADGITPIQAALDLKLHDIIHVIKEENIKCKKTKTGSQSVLHTSINQIDKIPEKIDKILRPKRALSDGTCQHRGSVYTHGEIWEESCMSYACKNGEIKNMTIPGCCETEYKKLYQNGDTWKENGKHYQCSNGQIYQQTNG
ncbi:unnamed protein product, partial [Meganyctiphanes norvegica]